MCSEHPKYESTLRCRKRQCACWNDWNVHHILCPCVPSVLHRLNLSLSPRSGPMCQDFPREVGFHHLSTVGTILLTLIWINLYLWSDNCIVYLAFSKSQILIKWSCEPDAKTLLLGWAAKHSIEFKCAFSITLFGLAWWAVRSYMSWYSKSPSIFDTNILKTIQKLMYKIIISWSF